LKYQYSSQAFFPLRLLIAPEGIEIKWYKLLLLLHLLLIAPEGIEMHVVLQLLDHLQPLLIAPEGIEIHMAGCILFCL